LHYYDDYDYDDDDAIHNNNVVTLETMRLLYEVQHIAVTLSTLPPQSKHVRTEWICGVSRIRRCTEGRM
jgi:hypothetical protein